MIKPLLFTIALFAASFPAAAASINQAAFDAVNIPAAYDAGFTGKGVTVVVIDTGTHEQHTAFLPEDESGVPYSKVVSDTSAGEFNTGNAFNKITWPTAPEGSEEYEEQLRNLRHGTHVAGIIAALPTDETMKGVAYNSRVAAYSMNKSDAEVLASINTAFPQAKIVNASWSYVSAPSPAQLDLLAVFFANDHLLVAAAGNEHAENPNSPAFLPHERDTALGVVSVGAFDPAKDKSSASFFAGYSNMAGDAANWTITAPGTIYSSVLNADDHEDMESYATLSGTSMATPVVSATAALVQEAYPFLTGKQIGDVLLTTADNDFSGFSPYVVQDYDEGEQYIIFTDVVDGENEDGSPKYADPDDIAEAAGIDCSEETCLYKTYAQVYGRGILDAGRAVKGPGALDATRMTEAEYSNETGQYVYTVNVGSYVRTNDAGEEEEYVPDFSNDIGEIRNPGHGSASVGLTKEGTGELILSGENSYKGDTVVAAGKLTLKGYLTGALKTAEEGTFVLDGGTVKSAVTNLGTTTTKSGTILAAFGNTGTLNLEGGTLEEVLTNTGTVKMAGGTLEQPMENTGTVNYYSGTAPHIVNGGTVNNYGMMSAADFVQGGALINQADGTVGSSFTVDTFTNRGRILLLPDGNGGMRSMTVTGDAVLESGSFVEADASYRKGEYTLLTGGTLTMNGAFRNELNISDYVLIRGFTDGNVLKAQVVYTQIGGSSNFSPEEQKVASIINNMFIDQDIEEFSGYYYYSEDTLIKKINELRDQISPVDAAALPLAGHLSENAGARLSSLRAPRTSQDSYRQHYDAPTNRMYRGKYATGRSGGDKKTPSRVWGQIVGGDGRFRASKKTARGKARLKAVGAQFGADTEIGDNVFAGITIGFAHSETDQSGDETKIKDYRAGVYCGFGVGGLSVDLTAAGGLQHYHSRRGTNITGTKVASKASYKGRSAEGSVNIGYDVLKVPRSSYSFGVRPYVAADVAYVKQDAYREKGTNPNLLLSVSGTNDTSVSAQTGVQFSYRWSDAQVTLDTGYRRLLSGGDPVSTAYFIADASQTRFKSLAETPDKNYLSVGLSLEANFSPYARFALRADQKRSENNLISIYSASWMYSF